MGYSANETFNKSLCKVIYSPLEQNGSRQTAEVTFEEGTDSDIQRGHKTKGMAGTSYQKTIKGVEGTVFYL